MTRKPLSPAALTLRFLAVALLANALSASSIRSAEPSTKPSTTYVAIGYGGRRMVSTDGVHWSITQEWAVDGKDDSNNLMGLCYGKGKFIATGGGGWSRETQAGHILVSEDGHVWHEATKLAFRVHPVLFGDGRFVVGGPEKQLYFSTDGEKWEAGAKIDFKDWAFWFRQGAFGNGAFVFMGNCNPKQSEYWVAVSKDGKTIDHFAKDLPQIRGLVFGNGRFVAVGPDGLRMSSTDGIKWEHRSDAPGNNLSAIIWTGKMFLATGGKTAYRSADGITWEEWPTKIPCEVLYGDEHVLIGSTWPGTMWSSTDGGKTWAKSEKMTPNGINQVKADR